MEDELKVYVEPNTNIIKQKPLVVKVTTPSLTALRLQGKSQAKVGGLLEPELTVVASGGSQAAVTGKAASLTAQASSGARLDLGELLAQDAQLVASSSAQIDARVFGKAKADASGGATITIRGGAEIDKTETGGAKVTSN